MDVALRLIVKSIGLRLRVIGSSPNVLLVSHDCPLVIRDSFGVSLSVKINSSHNPIWLENATAIFTRATVAAVFLLREPEISDTSSYYMRARFIRESLSVTTEKVIVAVFSIDSRGLLGPRVPPLSFSGVISS